MMAGWNVVNCSYSACFLLCGVMNVSPDTCAADVATQSTDFPALVMRFCVQLLLERGATTLSFLNTVETKELKLQRKPISKAQAMFYVGRLGPSCGTIQISMCAKMGDQRKSEVALNFVWKEKTELMKVGRCSLSDMVKQLPPDSYENIRCFQDRFMVIGRSSQFLWDCKTVVRSQARC